MLRYLTAGESHGRALVVIVEGMPAGLLVTAGDVQRGLARRRLGYRPGPPDAFRGRRGDPGRGDPARANPRFAHRHRDRQHRVAEVGDGDVAGSRTAHQAADPAPARPCRPGRDAQVRTRRRPGRAGAGLGPGDGRPGGSRHPGQAPPGPDRDRRPQPCGSTGIRALRQRRPPFGRSTPRGRRVLGAVRRSRGRVPDGGGDQGGGQGR